MIFEVQVSKGTETEKFKLSGSFEINRSMEAKSQTNLQVFFNILNPVTNAEILALEFVGNKSEIVV